MAQKFRGKMLKDTQVVRIPAEVWSRTVGYLRPTSHWNKGKLAEWSDRKVYSVRKSLARHIEGRLDGLTPQTEDA